MDAGEKGFPSPRFIQKNGVGWGGVVGEPQTAVAVAVACSYSVQCGIAAINFLGGRGGEAGGACRGLPHVLGVVQVYLTFSKCKGE